jgi:DNA integrity scanning protein DisA with diadenylate cyclase activity
LEEEDQTPLVQLPLFQQLHLQVEEKEEYFKEMRKPVDQAEAVEEISEVQDQEQLETHHQHHHHKEIQEHQERDLTETVQAAVAVEQEQQGILLIIEQRDQVDQVLELK